MTPLATGRIAKPTSTRALDRAARHWGRAGIVHDGRTMRIRLAPWPPRKR